ncbi:unnamed protein product [Prorocentrum cordatum]|uniref:EF-hand domain-containing protein n=1 Tax=Prorocentrum cordatum TaxID=2364126 RepID=A0ABN9XIH8_9DINO|nr:unnamed protein product [Polarella glacialis]
MRREVLGGFRLPEALAQPRDRRNRTREERPVLREGLGLRGHVAFLGRFHATLRVEAAFEKADAAKAGKLTKQGVADACRQLKKSERQIQKLLDSMEGQEVDVGGFKELFTGARRPWYYKVGCVPLPNHEKVLDVPVLGHVLCTTGDLVATPIDWSLRATKNAFRDPADWEVEKMFFEMDKDRKGVLNKDEVAAVLRKFGASEVDIAKGLEKLHGRDPNLYEFKVLMRGPKFAPSFWHNVPCVGMPLSNSFFRHLEPEVLTDKDIKEAFDQVDKTKAGKLDKTQVAECLWELGRPESQVQAAIEGMEHEEVDLEGFKKVLMEEPPRPWLKTIEVNETEIPLPNPAKIHEVPLIGMATKLTQDVLYDTYDWTAGACVRVVGLVDEVELERMFKEADTDEDGKLSRNDAAKLLRKWGKREFEIKDMLLGLAEDKDQLTHAEFRDWLYGVYEDEDPIAAAGAVAEPAPAAP